MDDRPAYENDFYGWSQDQAEVLRSMRGGPGLPNGLDLDRVIEEIEGVGGSQLSSVESFLRLIFVHLIKMASSPLAAPTGHWRSEIFGFHAEFLSRYSGSMRRKIDLPRIWGQARDQAGALLEDHGAAVAPGLAAACPFELDAFLVDRLDIDALVARAETAVLKGL